MTGRYALLDTQSICQTAYMFIKQIVVRPLLLSQSQGWARTVFFKLVFFPIRHHHIRITALQLILHLG